MGSSRRVSTFRPFIDLSDNNQMDGPRAAKQIRRSS
jgi:hypothetical protein